MAVVVQLGRYSNRAEHGAVGALWAQLVRVVRASQVCVNPLAVAITRNLELFLGQAVRLLLERAALDQSQCRIGIV